uniref:superoxide dismutase family protein n=1 Tax=Nonomuraea pusilla TaxID=46177 RepID=UPI0006E3BD97|nr:superoxide dismutase family protein [Nonomuraea pusilla]
MTSLKSMARALVTAGLTLSVTALSVTAPSVTAPSLTGVAAADSRPDQGHRRGVLARGTFAPPATARDAFTYDQAAVPAGARAQVSAAYPADGRTIVTLVVHGLLPNHAYGAHAHVNACGATGAAAGGHFQRVPSTDPAAANPENEIWLDFTTDEHGDGVARAVQDWRFGSSRPGSVVVHEHHTSHGDPPPAGSAGARQACLTVPF